MNDITVQELKQRLDAGENIHMIDVREAGERAEFNIGGEFIPLGFLIQKLDELSDMKDEEIVVYCRSGARSGLAKEFMTQRGFDKVRNLLGGMMAWQMNFPEGK